MPAFILPRTLRSCFLTITRGMSTAYQRETKRVGRAVLGYEFHPPSSMKSTDAGQIYYHFEYVGLPRSYKWGNTNNLVRPLHIMDEARLR